MPIFVYRAVTEDGTIVRNKVEDINRKNLIKKLKTTNYRLLFTFFILGWCLPK